MEANAVDLVFKIIIATIGGLGTLFTWLIKKTLDSSLERIDLLEKRSQSMELEMMNAVKSIEITLTKLNAHVEGFARYDDMINKLEEKTNRLEEKIVQIQIAQK